MYSDFHLHTDFSGDSDTPPRLQIEQAIRLGMNEMCITDHHDYDVDTGELNFVLDLPSYLSAMEQLKKQYEGQITLRIGIELGLQRHIHDYLKQLVSDYEDILDFVIGSNHFVDGYDPYYPNFFEGLTEREAYEHFFEVSLERFRCMDCYDVCGHLDYVVRYGPNQNQEYNFASYQEYIDPILKTLIEKGKGLECNTAGWKYGLDQPNPSMEILKRYHELGGEILTLGSDAHKPEHVGYDFGRLPEFLKECGFSYYTTFTRRKPVFHSL